MCRSGVNTFPTLSYVCPVPWSDMRGDERERGCAKCRRTVVNFSLLTEEERLRLLARERAQPGSVCVAYYQRLSGECVTPEKPLTSHETRRVIQIGATVAMAAGLTFAASKVATLDPVARERAEDFVDNVGAYFGAPPRPKPSSPVTLLVGMMVCAPPSAAPSPAAAPSGSP